MNTDQRDKLKGPVGGQRTAAPVYGIFAPRCDTKAGYRAFPNPKINAQIYNIFDEWLFFSDLVLPCPSKNRFGLALKR